MTLSQLDIHRIPATPEEAARMTASMRDLLHSQIRTTEQAAEISEAVKRLSVPAERKWISGRVATLLSQYFASSVPSEMMVAIAEDWYEELRSYPAWATQIACRWWMSEGNPDRRKKPLAGDIAARAKFEMGAVKLAASAVDMFERGATMPPSQEALDPVVSKEAANRIMAEAGFAPKRFGGGNA